MPKRLPPSPSPWSMEMSNWTAIIRDADGHMVCSVSIFNAMDEANARLMAAAPRLLEACERALPYLRDHIGLTANAGFGEDDLGDRIALDLCEEAIARAREVK
jgi:hypothetical protein